MQTNVLKYCSETLFPSLADLLYIISLQVDKYDQVAPPEKGKAFLKLLRIVL